MNIPFLQKTLAVSLSLFMASSVFSQEPEEELTAKNSYCDLGGICISFPTDAQDSDAWQQAYIDLFLKAYQNIHLSTPEWEKTVKETFDEQSLQGISISLPASILTPPPEEITPPSNNNPFEGNSATSSSSSISNAVSTGSSSEISTGSSNAVSTGSSSEISTGSSNAVSTGSSSEISTGSSNVVPTGSSSEISTGSSNAVSTGSSNATSTGSSNVVSTGSSNVVSTGSSNVVSTGSSNVVSTGSSNVISTGSSNVVSTGSSSEISTGSSNVISTGSSNVISTGSSSEISTGSSNVISTGSSNVISTGSSNVISTGSSNVISTGSSNVISTGSSNVISTGSSNVISTGSSSVVSTGESSFSSSPSNLIDQIPLCGEKDWGINLFEQKTLYSCFDNVISKNGRFLSGNEQVVSENDTVDLSILIRPDIKHLGEKVDTLLFVLQHPSKGSKQEEWLTRDKRNWQVWSHQNWKGTATDLPFDLKEVTLGYKGNERVHYTSMPIYQGQLTGFGGNYFLVFTGYRLMDGTVICNCGNPLKIYVTK